MTPDVIHDTRLVIEYLHTMRVTWEMKVICDETNRPLYDSYTKVAGNDVEFPMVFTEDIHNSGKRNHILQKHLRVLAAELTDENKNSRIPYKRETYTAVKLMVRQLFVGVAKDLEAL